MPGLQSLGVLLFWVIIGQGSRCGTGARRAGIFFSSHLPSCSSNLQSTQVKETGR